MKRSQKSGPTAGEKSGPTAGRRAYPTAGMKRASPTAGKDSNRIQNTVMDVGPERRDGWQECIRNGQGE